MSASLAPEPRSRFSICSRGDSTGAFSIGGEGVRSSDSLGGVEGEGGALAREVSGCW